ncbi:rhamnogalacturonan lyase family protein [Glycomyces salinus]|uniref:rhamnogalacturonan lyase family protein n=1 Tax=Glycomyces salinus TaxID=980294 RepID=UPI0018EC8A04|nr:RICIN domain-containing protein [Glycomyces salinus]
MKTLPKDRYRGHSPGTPTRRGRALLTVVTLAVAALTAVTLSVAGASKAEAFETGTWYTIESRHSGLVLNISGGSTAAGAELVQWTSNDSEAQQFRFLDSGDGYYRIQARHSGMVLDVWEWNEDNGATIAQYDDLDGTNQQWEINESGGYATFVNRFSGKTMDVWEQSTEVGGRISQYDSNGGANQQWRLIPVDDDDDDDDDDDPPTPGDRQMEDLDRGVVAVRSSGSDVLVSWRLLGLDPDGIGFNVYRSTGGGSETRINNQVVTGATNFTDSGADLSQDNTYRVRPVIDGQEQAARGEFTLDANNAVEPVVRIPLRDGGTIQFVWVGDLDGDGAYDYVVDRQTSPQSIEAYSSEGDFLWEVDMGHNSTDQNNIEGGSSTIDVGHNDGVTVYDFDGDGRSEVAVRIANGVTFGDGQTFNHGNNTEQFIAMLDGRTGALEDAAMVPTDYISDGPMYARMAACYLDGETPSLVTYMKNRVGNGGFNLMVSAWDFDGSSVDMQWKWLRNGNYPDGHNSRCLDVDGDGDDEFAEIGFVLEGDGSVKYSLGDEGVVHGDRWHIADIDPSRPGLEGYGIQQNNQSGLREYYYDAATGEMIWEHYGAVTDLGRGMAGDIDPRFPGMEVWTFDGVYNGPSNQLAEPNTSLYPWPQMGLWWDGDIGMELFNDGKIEKWDWNNPSPSNSLPRLESTWNYGASTGPRGQPGLIADVFGDWREEVIMPDGDSNELIIFTTDRPTDIGLYTLAHNPAYRNDMTVKGYMQSHHVDYFLGWDMDAPPRPDITY